VIICFLLHKTSLINVRVDFGDALPADPETGVVKYALAADLKGIISASYSLGAILALPFVPTFSQRYGRRWSIFFGSAVSVVGAIIQGLARNGKSCGKFP
jgi:MFS family permease